MLCPKANSDSSAFIRCVVGEWWLSSREARKARRPSSSAAPALPCPLFSGLLPLNDISPPLLSGFVVVALNFTRDLLSQREPRFRCSRERRPTSHIGGAAEQGIMLHRSVRTAAQRLSSSCCSSAIAGNINKQVLLSFSGRPLSSGASLQKAFQNTLKSQSSSSPKPSKVSVSGAVVDDLASSSSSTTSSATITTSIDTDSSSTPPPPPSKAAATSSSSKASSSSFIAPDPRPYIPPPVAPLLPTTPRQAFQPHMQQSACHEFAPKITVIGVGGAGGNAVNNMIMRGLTGVDFLVCNTDAQHIATTLTENRLQLGRDITQGLGCGANPDVGKVAGEESKAELLERVGDSHMVFITAGMGGGTGTGAAPVIAQTCLEAGILTVAVVTRPFRFEGAHRMRLAEEGIRRLQDSVDTLIVIPNQNLFKLVDNSTTLLDAFRLADDVLLAGVKGVTDLMTVPGLINLDFADVQSVMSGMGNAIMGTGQSSGEDRAQRAAEDALKNPLLGEVSIKSAKGMLVNITGGADMTLHEVDQAAQRVTEEVEDETANIIFGSAYDNSMEGSIRVSIVATGIDDLNGTHSGGKR